jgi:mevalonate kinase
VVSCVPGKIILSGEHAVVYGMPALGMAVNRFVTTSISEESGCDICFEFLNNGLKCITNLQELILLKNRITEQYRKFIYGKCEIKEVLKGPLELIQYTFIHLVENLFLIMDKGIKIQIDLNLPNGCGMGVSSALILSLIHGLTNYFNHPLEIDRYLCLGKEIENLQHGHSSGLDLFLSLHGGCHFFVDGKARQRNLPNIPLILVNTGKSEVSTGECVEMVAKYLRNGNLATSFREITCKIDLALQQGDFTLLIDNIHINHELLCRIGVVPRKVANFITEIEGRGNVGKISGAGAIKGDHAGIVLVIGDKTIADIVTSYGYTILATTGENYGLRLI